MNKRIRRGFLLVTLLGCALSGGCVSQDNIVIARAGPAVVDGRSADGLWSVQALALPRAAGVTLHGALYAKSGAVATVLYFGGNGFVLSQHQQHVQAIYADLPVNVVAFDHRGYGGSGGVATLDALYVDGVAIYDHVRHLPAVAGRPLLVHGHSLGSFIAGHVAANRRLDGLVLESSATTAVDWLAGRVPYLGWLGKGLAWLMLTPDMRDQGNARVVEHLDEPLLVVVGTDDEITHPQMAKTLFRNASLPPADKTLLVVPGATHMDAATSAQYAQAFRSLLERATIARVVSKPSSAR